MKTIFFFFLLLSSNILFSQTLSELYNKYMEYYKKGDYKQATFYAEKALKQAEIDFGKEDKTYAMFLNDLALIYSNQGKYSKAEPLYERALSIREKVLGLEHPDVAQSLNNLAFLYNDQGKFREAELLYKRALSIREKKLGPEHTLVALSLNNLAFLYQTQGEYAEAEPLYKRSLSIYEKTFGPDHPDVATSLDNLAALYRTQGKYKEAEPLCKRALSIREKSFGPDHPDVATSVNSLAALYEDQGKFREAEPLYKRSLSIREKTLGSDHPDVATSVNNLAVLYYNQGKYSEAEPLYKKALSIFEKALGPEHTLVALSLNNLAALYSNQGKHREAEPLYKRALSIREKSLGPDHPDVAQSLNNLAELYRNQGKYIEADPLYKRSLSIREKALGPDHPDVALSLNNLALLYNDQGKFREAEPLFKRSLSINEKALGPDHPEVAISLASLASLYDTQGKYREAEPLYKRALSIVEKALGPEHNSVATSLNNLALLYYDQGKYREAEPLFLKANTNHLNQIQRYFPSMSESDKEKFYETIKYNFEFYNSFFINRMHQNPLILCNMYENQLATKALILSATNKVKNRILNSDNDEIKNRYKEWVELKEYIMKSYSLSKDELEKRKINIDSIENNANEIEKELNHKSELFAKEYEKKSFSWKDVKNRLKDNEAAIEIVRFRLHDKKWTDTICYAFLIITKDTKDYPEIVLQKNGSDLEGLNLEQYLALLKLEDKASYSRYFSLLVQTLHRNVSGQSNVSGNKINKLYISPDGVYNQINLLTLIKPDGKYLLDEYDIQLVGNTKDLLSLGQSLNQSTDKAELFGYPNYKLSENKQIALNKKYTRVIDVPIYRLGDLTRFALAELPGTKIEIETISKLLTANNWKVNTYISDEALEEAVKSVNNPKVLHIATHGFFFADVEPTRDKMFGIESNKIYENQLLRSGLLLAGAGETIEGKRKDQQNSDNGILTAYEAMSLNLDNTDLVVLSACQTGQGQIKNGEGVYGLQRAFQIAGAKSIIMSLWSVSDEATQELMTSFYTKWIKYKDKRKAFKEAQQEIKDKYKTPFYWGAFVMVGE